MPTYTYKCIKCGREVDEVHSIRDDSERRCPACLSLSRRMIGSPLILNYLDRPYSGTGNFDVGRYEKQMELEYPERGPVMGMYKKWETGWKEKEEDTIRNDLLRETGNE